MENVVQLIGLSTGAVAVSIAIYFQMISKKLCPVRYTFGFFIVGSALILTNARAFSAVNSNDAAILEALVYLSVLIGELIIAYKLQKNLKDRDVSFYRITWKEMFS